MASAGRIAVLHKSVAKNAMLRVQTRTATTVPTTRLLLSQTSKAVVGATPLRTFAYPVSRTFTTTVRLAQQKQDNSKDGTPNTPPSTSLGASKAAVDSSALPDPAENINSIEDLIRELSKESSTIQAQTGAEKGTEAEADLANGNQEGQQQDYQDYRQQQKKRDWSSWRQSKSWRYLWIIFYWSCLGSLPIHLMMVKNEAKAVQQKLEWKIAVLQDMRDKLARGESIEEEEALLAVGMDRSKRELQHQVDDQMFEELIKSAEKLDMDVGLSTKVPIGELQEPVGAQAVSEYPPTPAAVPAPQPTVPRKPAPPKSEKSFL
ncbi:hypothetical protein BGZ73_005622 [Actinomortierella ambigua]|nr:hypothetical protein BGZ73_005622 [Actinomortierella ambigua]